MKISLRWKMIACFLLASIVPLFLSLSVFVSNTSAKTRENIADTIEIRSSQNAEQISEVLTSVDQMFLSLIRNGDLREFLYAQYNDSQADALNAYQSLALQSQIDTISKGYTVRLYNANPVLGIAPLTNNSMGTFLLKYGADAANVSTKIQMQYLEAYGTQPARIGFYRIYLDTAVDPIYITIEVPVADLLPHADLEHALLLDDTIPIIYSNEELFGEISLSNEDLTQIQQKGTLSVGQSSYLATIYPLSSMPDNSKAFSNAVSLLCLFPYDAFEQTLQESLIGIIPLSVLCVIFSVLVTIIFTRRMTTRISAMQAKTKRVLNLDFNIAEPVMIQDELGDLENDIYEMASALAVQIEREYEAIQAEGEQRLLNEQLHNAWVKAQIASLKHQINPHYLFNTLESIRMHLLLKGDKETAKILQIFAASYRKSLEVDSGDYTLQDELDTINDFLAVQKYRLGDRFVSEIQVDETALDCKMPKLLLQPLVENAFFHGIELSNRLGNLAIHIHRNNDAVSIMVKDNGLGIPADKLSELKAKLESNDAAAGTGIGINNIASRLRLLYGPETNFAIESQYGHGTTIQFEIPYRK